MLHAQEAVPVLLGSSSSSSSKKSALNAMLLRRKVVHVVRYARFSLGFFGWFDFASACDCVYNFVAALNNIVAARLRIVRGDARLSIGRCTERHVKE
jgi:hypothetical protein